MTDHDDLLAQLGKTASRLASLGLLNHFAAVEDAAAAIRETDTQLESANSTIATQRTEYEQINDAAITLQAQLEAARKVADGTTEAQRTLFEQVETERKAREEADKQRRANSDRAAKWERRAEAAESQLDLVQTALKEQLRGNEELNTRLATIEADTIERCARLFDGLTFGRYLHPSITIRALNKETPATAAAPQNRRVRRLDRRAEPAPKVILETAADTAVSWGHPRQNYPGGPIYRVGTSTGMVIDPADTEGKT